MYFRLFWWFRGKKIFLQSRRHRRHGFNPWVRKIPWRRKWQLTPVFLLGKSHGQRSLVGYSPWGRQRVEHGLVTKQQQAKGTTHFSFNIQIFNFPVSDFKGQLRQDYSEFKARWHQVKSLKKNCPAVESRISRSWMGEGREGLEESISWDKSQEGEWRTREAPSCSPGQLE